MRNESTKMKFTKPNKIKINSHCVSKEHQKKTPNSLRQRKTSQFKETKHKFALNCLTELVKLCTIQSIKGINGKLETKG